MNILQLETGYNRYSDSMRLLMILQQEDLTKIKYLHKNNLHFYFYIKYKERFEGDFTKSYVCNNIRYTVKIVTCNLTYKNVLKI